MQSDHYSSLSIGLAFVTLIMSGFSHASPIIYKFSGNVTNIYDPHDRLDNYNLSNSKFTGYFSYNPSASPSGPQNPLPNVRSYEAGPMTISIGNKYYISSSGYSMGIENNVQSGINSRFDRAWLRDSGPERYDFPNSSIPGPNEWALRFMDTDGTAFTSASLPPSLRLSNFEQANVLIGGVTAPGELRPPLGNDYQITGRISQLTRVSSFTPVPARIYGVFVGSEDSTQNYTLQGDDMARRVYDKFSALPQFVEGKLLTGTIDANSGGGGVTQASIKNSIDNIKSKMSPNDIFVFYANGHGASDFIGPETTATFGDEFIRTGGISDAGLLTDDELYSMLTGMDNINKWIFIDACHSGGFWGNNSLFDSGDLEGLSKVALLASAKEDGLSYATDNGLSGFGLAIEDALRRNAQGLLNSDIDENSSLTLDEISKWVLNHPFGNQGFPGAKVYEMGFGEAYDWDASLWQPIAYSTDDFTDEIPAVNSVPEPSTAAMVGIGVLWLRRYRRNALGRNGSVMV